MQINIDTQSISNYNLFLSLAIISFIIISCISFFQVFGQDYLAKYENFT